MKRDEIREAGKWPAYKAQTTWVGPGIEHLAKDHEERRPVTLVDLRCSGPRHDHSRIVGAITAVGGVLDLVLVQPAPGGPERNVARIGGSPLNAEAWRVYCDKCGELEPLSVAQFEEWGAEAKTARQRLTKTLPPRSPRVPPPW